jgi:hypothetical protein
MNDPRKQNAKPMKRTFGKTILDNETKTILWQIVITNKRMKWKKLKRKTKNNQKLKNFNAKTISQQKNANLQNYKIK